MAGSNNEGKENIYNIVVRKSTTLADIVIQGELIYVDIHLSYPKTQCLKDLIVQMKKLANK